MLAVLSLLAFAPQAGAPQDPSVLPPACRIEGTVVDPLQQPLPACEVWVERDGVAVARTHTDATGWFALPPEPQAPTLVRASAPGRASGAIDLDTFGRGRAFVRVPMFPVRALRGVVRTTDGKPVPDAWIVAAPTGPPALASVTARRRSAADGSYELRDVLPGPVAISAWSPGFEMAVGSDETDGDATVDLELDPQPSRHLRLCLEGASSAQLAATVFHCHAEGQLGVPLPPPLAAVRPDAAGVAELIGLPERARLVVDRVSVPGVVVEPGTDWIPPGPSEWTCTFRVVDHGLLRGRLVDRDGHAVPGCRIVCWSQGAPTRSKGPVWGVSAAGGEFAITSPVAAGEGFALRLVDDDWTIPVERDSAQPGYWLGRHDVQTAHAVHAMRGQRALLQVVDATKAPMPGLTVDLLSSPNRDACYWLAGGVTDLQGRVELHAIETSNAPAPTVHVAFDLPLQTMPLRAGKAVGERIDLGTMQLEPRGSVEGTVLDDKKQPCFGARVLLITQHSQPDDLVAVTDRAGRYRFGGLPSGAYWVFVAGSHEAPGVDLAPGEDAHVDLHRQ